MFWRRHKFDDQLSAYIDGRLSDRERRSLEAHLQACSTCQRQLADLQATVAALRNLPLEEAPRSFVLTPEQVAPPSPAPPLGRLGLPMRLAAAGLSLALALVLVVDIADLRGGDTETAPAAPAAEEAPPIPAPSPAPGAAQEMFEAAPPAEALLPEGERAAGERADAPEGGELEALPAPEAAGEPEAAGAPEGAPTPQAIPSQDGGIDPLRAAEIALAAALAASILIAAAISLRARRSA